MAKKVGHYCWKCGRHRANEKFSGKGHARHMCKDCQREQKRIARTKRKGLDIQEPEPEPVILEISTEDLFFDFDDLDSPFYPDENELFDACIELEEAEKKRRATCKAGRAKQKANEKEQKAKRALRIKTFTEEDLLHDIVLFLQPPDTWQDISVIAQKLNDKYADIRWKRYKCKNFSRFIEKYPDRFLIKRNGMHVEIALNPIN